MPVRADEQHRDEVSPWWHPIVEFATHVIVGTLIFATIALAVVGLHHFTKWLDPPTEYVAFGLGTAEQTMFTADLILFVLFIVKTAWRTGRRLIHSWNE